MIIKAEITNTTKNGVFEWGDRVFASEDSLEAYLAESSNTKYGRNVTANVVKSWGDDSTEGMRAVFADMCQRHDLTYSYSDDNRAYNKGRSSLSAINAYKSKLAPEVAKKVWNDIVDTKMVEDVRKNFYWS